jgi:hypothetical protein
MPGWSIHFSSAVKLTAGGFDPGGLTLWVSERKMSGFASREAAVAWILRYLDARIVPSSAELSSVEPTCCISEDS